MKKILYTLITIVTLAGILSSCSKDSLDPTFAQNKEVDGAITNADEVLGVLYGCYNDMTGSGYYGRDFIIWGEVRSDNCYSNGNSGRFVTEASMILNDSWGFIWNNAYSVIANANIVIDLDPAELDGDPDELNHLIGQAYAIRALAHYDLLIYYGQMNNGEAASPGLGIPYVKEFKGDDYLPARLTIDQTVDAIMADCDMAISMMDSDFDDGTRQSFGFYAAHALKARVGTYFKRWDDVIAAAVPVIASGEFDIIPESQFISSWKSDASANSLFELAFSSIDNANINGLQQIYRGAAYGDVGGLPNLLAIFEAGDVRADPDMIGPDPDKAGRPVTNLGKYPSYDYSDNIPILRYEEVILNYAEALLKQETPDAAAALVELNKIPAERGASLYTEATEDNILLERRKEFCFEGFRFHDLARTGRDIPDVDTDLTTHGLVEWGTWQFALPVPVSELDANPNILQNDGY